jgi:hypothetical protein
MKIKSFKKEENDIFYACEKFIEEVKASFMLYGSWER